MAKKDLLNPNCRHEHELVSGQELKTDIEKNLPC